MPEAINKLNDCVKNIAEHTVIDALETCDVEHSKAFIKAVLKRAFNGLLASVQDDSSGIKESFEYVIV